MARLHVLRPSGSNSALVRFLVHGKSISYITVDALSLAAAIVAALHLSYRAVICCGTHRAAQAPGHGVRQAHRSSGAAASDGIRSHR